MKASKYRSSEAPIQAVVLSQKALSSHMAESLHSAAYKTYQDIAVLMATQSTDAVAVAVTLSATHKYLPHASSVSLGAVVNRKLIDNLLDEIGRSSAGCYIRKILGSNEVLCDLDQAWIRQQYATHLYPPKHAPHGWHQDGALGFDFLTMDTAKLDPEALLPSVTCWIALTICGVNAPGLEFVSQIVEELQLPKELTDNRIRNRYSLDSFWKPQMEAGDAVIFLGSTLHRTHVMKEMQANRTSVELRFIAKGNISQRLSEDCFVPLPQAIESERHSLG